ncbi:MAG: penicillin-binding protein 2, partial [Novosphingobium sp.]
MKLGSSQHVSSGTLKNAYDRRAMLIGGLQAGVGVLLAGRVAWLSLAQNEKYRLASESNRVNLTLISPRRGAILDRNGAPIAANRADFRVDLIPDRLVDTDRTLGELGRLLKLSDVRIKDLRDKLEKARGFQPVEVAAGLDWDSFAAISVRLPDLPGVLAQRSFSRWYPTG